MAERDEGTRPMSTEAVARTVERYEILDQIGHGGMADVYRARDRRLDRLVALKILSAGTPSESDRARFLGSINFRSTPRGSNQQWSSTHPRHRIPPTSHPSPRSTSTQRTHQQPA